MNIEQQRRHYDAMIRQRYETVVSILKTLKGLVDSAERHEGTDLERIESVISGVRSNAIAQFAIQLQDATAELRQYAALKVLLESVSSVEAA